jgi:hypothetical protein
VLVAFGDDDVVVTTATVNSALAPATLFKTTSLPVVDATLVVAEMTFGSSVVRVEV